MDKIKYIGFDMDHTLVGETTFTPNTLAGISSHLPLQPIIVQSTNSWHMSSSSTG